MLFIRWKSLFVAASAIATTAAGGPAFAQADSDRLVPFSEFISGVSAAQPSQYVGRSSSQVRDSAAFTDMRNHVLRMYDTVSVGHSYVVDGQTFDCVPVGQQPSVRLQGLRGLAAPPPQPPIGGSANGTDPSGQPTRDATQDQAGGRDRFGQLTTCEPGTIPIRRITLDELSRFQSLQHFFEKGPNGAGQVQPRGATRAATHKYAHNYQTANNFGGVSNLNIWNPTVNTARTHIFSLSQQWWVARPGGVTQTVEGGWQHYPQKYGASSKSVLFIYWTADGYNRTGCYNLDCAAFVQTNRNIRIGGGFSNYSVEGGAQYILPLTWRLFNGNWWLAVNGTWVGYYPGSKWSNRGLAQLATSLDFGGETVGDTNWPAMGSGRFPGSGSGRVAFQSNVIRYTNNAGASAVAILTRQEPSPRCYKTTLTNNSATTFKTYFYFGGPGGTGC